MSDVAQTETTTAIVKSARADLKAAIIAQRQMAHALREAQNRVDELRKHFHEVRGAFMDASFGPDEPDLW